MGRQATRKLQHTLNRLRTKPRKIELQKCGIAMFLPVTTFWPLAPSSSMHTTS